MNRFASRDLVVSPREALTRASDANLGDGVTRPPPCVATGPGSPAGDAAVSLPRRRV